MILVILWDFSKLSDPSARLRRPRVKVAAGIKGFGAFQAPGSPFPRAAWLLGSFPVRLRGWGSTRLSSAGPQLDWEQVPKVVGSCWGGPQHAPLLALHQRGSAPGHRDGILLLTRSWGLQSWAQQIQAPCARCCARAAVGKRSFLREAEPGMS